DPRAPGTRYRFHAARNTSQPLRTYTRSGERPLPPAPRFRRAGRFLFRSPTDYRSRFDPSKMERAEKSLLRRTPSRVEVSRRLGQPFTRGRLQGNGRGGLYQSRRAPPATPHHAGRWQVRSRGLRHRSNTRERGDRPSHTPRAYPPQFCLTSHSLWQPPKKHQPVSRITPHSNRRVAITGSVPSGYSLQRSASTDTTAAPGSSPPRCAMPAWRSSTRASARHPRWLSTLPYRKMSTPSASASSAAPT